MKKIAYLEGLRGVAALVVVISHFIRIFYPALLESNPEIIHNEFELWISGTPINLLYNGNFAVCIFFILSGYVLSIKYHVKKDFEIIYEMGIKRYIRLAIPVATSIFLAFLLMKLDIFFYDEIIDTTKATMENPYILHHDSIRIIKLAFFDIFILGDASYNPVVWTMRYELIGSYLVFILIPIIVLLKNDYIKYIFYTISLVFIVTFLGLFFIPFILGVILCNMHYNNRGVFKYKGKKYKFFMLIIGLFLGSYPYTDTSYTIYNFLEFDFLGQRTSGIYHIGGAFFLMISMLSSSLLQNLFSKKLFYFLGKISFSMYLIHFIILCSFSSFIFKELIQYNLNYNLMILLTIIPTVILILISSYFMNKYVDSLSIKVAKIIYNKFFKIIFQKVKRG